LVPAAGISRAILLSPARVPACQTGGARLVRLRTAAAFALRMAPFSQPAYACQRSRSGAAAGFRILSRSAFLYLTEEPEMAATRSGLVILTALLSASVAVAQQAGKPCAGDIKTLCAGIQPGEGRIKACIKSHLTGLSPTCEERLLTVAVTGKVCKTDITNLCAGVVPGTGGIRTCIKSHMAEVSDPCKDAMSQAAAGRKILGGGDL
jgi:hypothetical protein